jgi:hypothetical protein
MLNHFLNKQTNNKDFIPFINKFYQFSKYYFSENNKTYNKLIQIAMPKEKGKNIYLNQVNNTEFSNKHYAEEENKKSSNNYNNLSNNNNYHNENTRENSMNSNLNRNYDNFNKGNFNAANINNIHNESNLKINQEGKKLNKFINDSTLEKDFGGKI